MRLVTRLPIFALAIASAVYWASQTASRCSPQPSRDALLLFASWKAKFGKLYATPAEDSFRLKVFVEQKSFVDSTNQKYAADLFEFNGQSLELPMFSLNGFADMSHEEFTARYAGESFDPEDIEQTEITVGVGLPTAAASSDASDQQPAGVLDQEYELRIRQQGSCGSCWAHAAIASVEKFYFDKTGQRLDFSQQELVDCDASCNGCVGGSHEKGLKYIYENGVTLASQYPYIAAESKCRRNQTTRITPGIQLSRYEAFSLSVAETYSNKGYHPTVSVYGTNTFRYLSSSPETFIATLSPDCLQIRNHAINILSVKDGIVTVFNSWGLEWGNRGTKAIRPCNPGNLFGNMARMAQPYGS